VDCKNANQSRYYYQLEPLMKDFEQNADGHLNFSGLPNGSYRLRVRGGDKLGNITPSTDTLDIIVEPFFWQTAWFKLLCIAATIVIISFIVARRIQNIRKEAALKQKIVESEMMALRAQMNPHFIFNCLNSIDNLIQDDQKEKATVYLAKFARLIRAILENSKKETIPCWKDAEALQLYLEMEMLRLDDKFSYSLDVDEKIMQGNYKVPPMILQPFVENAIHHGLLNKLDADKQLHITARVINGSIKYTVEDNGVGRTRAAEYKKINRPGHQSMGMQITTERINYFNESERSAIRITDLYDEDGTPAGTRVEICLNNQN
jgi:LytS/YehU family sensor histidine kinase